MAHFMDMIINNFELVSQKDLSRLMSVIYALNSEMITNETVVKSHLILSVENQTLNTKIFHSLNNVHLLHHLSKYHLSILQDLIIKKMYIPPAFIQLLSTDIQNLMEYIYVHNVDRNLISLHTSTGKLIYSYSILINDGFTTLKFYNNQLLSINQFYSSTVGTVALN